MLTKIRIKNLKCLDDVEIELGGTVVFVGPNNSGKTTALQALSLWHLGVQKWTEKRKDSPAEKRSGVTINRKDVISLPIPSAKLLWRDMHVRDGVRENGKNKTQNVRIDIIVEGTTESTQWQCGIEYDFFNEESFYCRPLRLSDSKEPGRMPVPPQASRVKTAFLPPMSGLADREFVKQPGEIGVLIGQGQTAQVLRNLCHQIYTQSDAHSEWDELTGHIERLFGVRLNAPEIVPERSEVVMSYDEKHLKGLDLSCSGRGLQQTMLLLAHLYANPKTVLLIDEPDAHLEIIRQRRTYDLVSNLAAKNGSQVIIASHSEVILNEAAQRDTVIAFIGAPHRIDNRKSQLLKALKDYGFEEYFKAEERGWVLYLEGATDLAILQAFARELSHPVAQVLSDAFVHYVANQPTMAHHHFFAIQEAYPDIVGIALFDRLDTPLQNERGLTEIAWKKREIENYVCTRETLLAFARGEESQDLFAWADHNRRVDAMSKAIDEIEKALLTLRKPSPWSADLKVSDEFLDQVFPSFFQSLGLPNQMEKTNYHRLAEYVPKDAIDPEVIEKLDAIHRVALSARPRR